MTEMYRGVFSQKRVEHVQFRCPCGELTPQTIVVGIDAKRDPKLAKAAIATELDDTPNVIQCSFCKLRTPILTPYTYHDGAKNIFVTVLPETSRHRELEQVAKIMALLAKETVVVPRYLLEGNVVYGGGGLSKHLDAASQTTEVLPNTEVPIEREAPDAQSALEDWAAREAEFAKKTIALDERSSDLTARELNLQDRKKALDRRSSELGMQTDIIMKAKIQLQLDGEMPTALLSDSTETLDTGDILTSAPDPGQDGKRVATVSGHTSSRTNEGANEIDALIVEDLATETSIPAIAQMIPPPPRVESERPARVASRSPKRASSMADHLERESSLKLIRGNHVRLMATVSDALLEELIATDIRAVLQLHDMPSYPLVTLTLARAATLAGEKGHPYAFHFDIGKAQDRGILAKLAKEFAFTLDLYNEEHEPVHLRRFTAPLAANVSYVNALANDSRKRIAFGTSSFSNAVKEFEDPEYDRLGERHELSKEFNDGVLDALETPNEVQKAISLCECFSKPAAEEYLLALRSYPVERWHQRRRAVMERAMVLGVWMGPVLARIAVSAELGRSRKDLLVRTRAHFEEFLQKDPSGLREDEIETNWQSLDDEANSLGIPIAARKPRKGKRARTASGTLARSPRHSKDTLVDPLAEIRKLCVNRSMEGLKVLSGTLSELPVEKAPEAFAALAELGQICESSLMECLLSPENHLRHGAALALCEIGDEKGIESVCELLMSEKGSMWQEFAFAIGQIGAKAIMPLVTQIKDARANGQSRAVWALGYIAANGAQVPVKTLSKGRNKTVAKVATSALKLEQRMSKGDKISTERDEGEKQYTARFYQSRKEREDHPAWKVLNSSAMILDESDLIEATE